MGTDPLFVKTQGTYYWYENDHQGTPQKIISTSGSVVWSAVALDSFGGIQIQAESIVNNLRLPGQYYDQETGLYYNWHRYYDPAIGRYLQTDPIGDGLNLYVYCLNNPNILLDPYGLCAVNWTKEKLQEGLDWAVYAGKLGRKSIIKWFDSLGNFYPDAEMIGVSGTIGLLFGLTGGSEIIINSESGEVSLFINGGFEAGWTSYGVTGKAGFIWNLNDNSKYEGPFLSFNAAGMHFGGSAFFSSDAINSQNIAQGPYGISVNYSASMLPGTLSFSSTYYREVVNIPYLGYILDPIGTILNYFDDGPSPINTLD